MDEPIGLIPEEDPPISNLVDQFRSIKPNVVKFDHDQRIEAIRRLRDARPVRAENPDFTAVIQLVEMHLENIFTRGLDHREIINTIYATVLRSVYCPGVDGGLEADQWVDLIERVYYDSDFKGLLDEELKIRNGEK